MLGVSKLPIAGTAVVFPFLGSRRHRGLTKLVVDSHVQFRLGNVDAFQLADGHLEMEKNHGFLLIFEKGGDSTMIS